MEVMRTAHAKKSVTRSQYVSNKHDANDRGTYARTVCKSEALIVCEKPFTKLNCLMNPVLLKVWVVRKKQLAHGLKFKVRLEQVA